MFLFFAEVYLLLVLGSARIKLNGLGGGMEFLQIDLESLVAVDH